LRRYGGAPAARLPCQNREIESFPQASNKAIRWKPIGLTFAITLLLSALTAVSYQVYAQSEQQQKLALYDLQNKALNALPTSVKKVYLEEFGLQLPH
jgi:hypothetical protein